MFIWWKALHIIAVVCWFAGLFYLPRLYVYHCQANNNETRKLFATMEYKLFWYITTPSAIVTILTGFILWWIGWVYLADAIWLYIKALLVLGLCIFHIYCGQQLRQFNQQKQPHSEVFYRYLNEVPTLFLITIVILAVVQPSF